MALILLALTGCGGNSKTAVPTSSSTTLTSASALTVAKANLAIARYCVAVIGSGTASSAQQDAVLHGVARLIAVARQNPDAILNLRPRRTMRQVLGDAASMLDNGNCEPSLAREIDRALTTLG